jgi:hypothetical protein
MTFLRLAFQANILAVALAMAGSVSASAQTLDSTPAQATPEQPLLPDTPTEPTVSLQNPSAAIINSQSPDTDVAGGGASSPLFGSLFNQKFPFFFGFKAVQTHSDNIFFQPKKTEDYITKLSPVVGFTLGDPLPLAPALGVETLDTKTDRGDLNYFQVTYYPTLTLYARNSQLDDVDEYADAIYTHQFSRLTLSLDQKYEKLSEPTIQLNAVGGLVNRDIYTTTANANYIYSDQLSTYGTFSQTVNTFVGTRYTDNTEWIADYYFLYQLFPKLALGLGPRVGWDDIDTAPNQSFQGALVHANFVVTGKFTIGGAAGAEVREFEHNSSPTEVTPIVEGIATYQPFDSMTFKLTGDRHRIVSSGQAGSDYTASVVQMEFKQRFFQKIYFTLNAGYEDDQYTAAGPHPNRDDSIYFLRGGLEWKSYRGLVIDASYQYLRDDSTIKAFTFNESRAIISATFRY